MIDLEELKRLHSERVDSAFAQRIWNDAIDSCFPAILAKLEAAQRQTAWLVENGESPPKFRAMEQGLSVWVSDPNLALRFARRVDGEMFANEDEDAWFVREHMWVDAPAAFDKEQQ